MKKKLFRFDLENHFQYQLCSSAIVTHTNAYPFVLTAKSVLRYLKSNRLQRYIRYTYVLGFSG